VPNDGEDSEFDPREEQSKKEKAGRKKDRGKGAMMKKGASESQEVGGQGGRTLDASPADCTVFYLTDHPSCVCFMSKASEGHGPLAERTEGEIQRAFKKKPRSQRCLYGMASYKPTGNKYIYQVIVLSGSSVQLLISCTVCDQTAPGIIRNACFFSQFLIQAPYLLPLQPSWQSCCLRPQRRIRPCQTRLPCCQGATSLL